ncbi:efflux RND transporter permease subunit [Shewanella xiamenensis]|uniref:efflux RND transporter permease subunit n=1 Tax=Shewanella xiamenensis TaxID=332186 RepID=UPI0024A74DC0|nr:CusA/CzcA family heavy metal efflux RND transporter [Shewanella xiamenensis]MDI5835687.1 CusA/CzcA family heavy metal efflux RND transporter [Shewanella xiamenensis]MDI5839526.1 CusA/CzcA family heavy metal efflux RND transporter [Shewanella xiamenensis]MDI5843878.1 CusA/CzcA family heavy metal efflux RND transporter [Shewanella xiamenensis]MDI5846643.1 CusA/CzcA family heavy metal efflux RND transporter [Shewanella xiamenensis]MDI5851083.1 CusA/CzcA family heavy metal efflux RND transporte
MLTSVIRFSLTQRLFVLIVALILMLAGARAWFAIPLDAFPDISPTQVKIILKAPGMTPEEIEAQITVPIETELLGIPKQSILRSTTKYAISDITLDFEEGTDIYWARQQVSERLTAVWDNFPEGVSGGVAPMSTPLSEIFMFSLENPNLSLLERRQLLEWEIRPLLRTVPGVADVNILGGYAKSFSISPNPAAMAAAGVSFAALQQAIVENNHNEGAGKLTIGTDTIIVRSEGRIDDIDELKQLVIKADNAKVYRLQDLADIQIGHLARYGAVTKDGNETAEALIIALKDANTAQVVNNIKEKLAQISLTLPEGSQINTFYDRANLINTAIETISNALFEAVVLVIVLLALFLGNVRAALVVSLSLPLAALFTFLMMDHFNLSANLMSLGGLVIAIGMLVDSSVVVVENMVNLIATKQRLPRLHLIFRATKDVAIPVVSGTVIVIIVFSPLLTLSGLEGKLFTPVAITIVFAMLSALVLSLTVIPVIASYLVNEKAAKEPKAIEKLKHLYLGSLKACFGWQKPFMLTAFSLLIVSLGLFSLVGKTFMPTLDEGDIILQLEKSPSISLDASIAIDKQIQQTLLSQIPEIKQMVARTGADEIGLDPMGLNETDVFLELAPRSEWRFATKEQLIDAIRTVLLKYPGVNFNFTQPIQMRVSEMLTGSIGDVAIKVFGNDIETLGKLTGEIEQLVTATQGSVDVKMAMIEGSPFINLTLDNELARGFGMSTMEFARYLKSQLEGVVVTEVLQGKKRTPVLIANNQAQISNINELQNQLLVMPDHSLKRLSDVAVLSYKQGPILIEREQGNRFSVITTNVQGRDIVGFVEELNSKIANEIKLPSGYSVSFGGEFENQQRATSNLLLVIPIAIALITLILFTTFGSLAKSGLILANVPFAMMGGIVSLYLSGEYLSVPASVGFIALLGVAVLNGVVMVSYYEQTKYLFGSLRERVEQGAARRLRPILMTATTAMFGLIPLVFASGPGAEIQKPLAIVVIGGLLTSTITTLYLLPMLYFWLEKRR